LVRCGAALSVHSADQLAQVVLSLWRDADRRRSMALAAARWHRVNQGALARTLAALLEELEHSRPART